ncbi:putative craniofacial development protein 2-like [Caerostris darwini]|uniref:Craniofacial development protein 2-like n=1 Tax=Caerostris darwini TaxID=1538125 RepID=A0AAV4SYC5_9ARAC|nr:putative craniofacial development protein 2-like [Caerostris darwini]
MSQEAERFLIDWKSVSERIIQARFYPTFLKLSIIQVYVTTNGKESEEIDSFYEQLQSVLEKYQKHDMLILMRNLIEKAGKKETEVRPVGNETIGQRNENGEIFVAFCELNSVIESSIFKHKDIHNTTWVSPDGFIAIRRHPSGTETKLTMLLLIANSSDLWKILQQWKGKILTERIILYYLLWN